MKKLLASVFSFFTFIVAFAQEKSIELKINGEAADGENISKVILLILFTVIILIFVVRTFKGKPSA